MRQKTCQALNGGPSILNCKYRLITKFSPIYTNWVTRKLQFSSVLPKMVGQFVIKACERSGHSGVCIGLGRPSLPGTGVSWTTLDQTLRSTTYTWMIKFEIAGCLQHVAQMKVFVGRCRGLANSLYARPGKCFLFTKFRPDVPSSGCRSR